MSNKIFTKIFAPQGGMNQDDSMITPTKDAAGRNAFELGDYKYALNARIGSSRYDNFGDLETIKGTTAVTNYFTRQQLFSNNRFIGSLTGWSTIEVGTGNWTYSGSNSAIISPESGDIIYQAVTVSDRNMQVRIDYSISPSTVTGLRVKIVYLQGTTVLSSEVLTEESSASTLSKYFYIELPEGCDGIGLQVLGTAVGVSVFGLSRFDLNAWLAGARPSGTDKMIGKREDKERNVLYYCMYNSDGNHTIRYYNPVTNAEYQLLKWSGLNFRSTDFVSMAIIDNWIGLTDKYNPPRLIDVDTITDLYERLTDSSLPSNYFREFHISFHKWAPIMPPVLKGYYDGVNDNYKKFENKVYQFSYRYIYKGRLKSRWSPISNVAQRFLGKITGRFITGINVYFPGFILDEPGAAVQYNYFGHNDYKFTEAVEYIEFAYRENSLDLWRILERREIEFAGNNTEIDFTGQSNSTPIPSDDFAQLFDVVPFLAGCIEAIDNRFVFADIVEEEEAAPPIQVENVGSISWDGSGNSDNFLFGSTNAADNTAIFSGMSAADASELGFRNTICRTTFKGRGLYKISLQWLRCDGWRSASYTNDDLIVEIPEETGVVDKIYALKFTFPASFRPPEWAVAYQIMVTNCLNIDYFMFGACNIFTYLIDDATQPTDETEVGQDLRDRIRQHFENSRLVTGLEYDKYLDTLAKNPFYRSVVSQIRKSTVTTTLADASKLYINVNNWYNSSKKNAGATQNNPINNLYYNFREGDRVRFMASTDATPTNPSDKVVYDMPILEFTGRAIIVEKPDGVLWVPGTDVNTQPEDHIIEVYTPRVPGKADYVYYERGEWYAVLYPGTENRDMSKRVWDYTNNGAVTCDTYGIQKVFQNFPMVHGDCHALSRTNYFDRKSSGSLSTNMNTGSMNPDPSKTFDVWEKNSGRPSPAYTDIPQVIFKKTLVRFGGQIVEQSFVNNINRFRDEDQKIFPSEYGAIRSLINTANAQVESVGAILLAIGERETFSIYVNRTTLEELSGRTQVALSDRVLGSYNTLLGSHGTLNPESVSVDRGRVYFWDAFDGCWVRYGRDGLTEISFYKMRNWFREIGALLINEYGSTPPVVLSEFDPYNEELITFINHSTLPSTFRDYSNYKGSLFSEEDKRWKSCHNYDPDMFCRINNQVIACKGGVLYLLETNSNRSTFFGTKFDVMIEPVFTNLQNIASWQYISTVTTHKWSVERFLSEYRGAKTKRQSAIELALFEDREDSYYYAIPNDVNTPNVSSAIINGDKMRSKAIRALLKLDPSIVAESLLHYVQIGLIDSPKNP